MSAYHLPDFLPGTMVRHPDGWIGSVTSSGWGTAHGRDPVVFVSWTDAPDDVDAEQPAVALTVLPPYADLLRRTEREVPRPASNPAIESVWVDPVNGYVAVEFVGGMKRYARLWSTATNHTEWTWRLPLTATQVWPPYGRDYIEVTDEATDAAEAYEP